MSRCQVEKLPELERLFMAVSEQRVCAGAIICRGVRRKVDRCAACRHVVDLKPAAASVIALRCLYLESDPVSEVMTEIENLAVFDESEPVLSARGSNPVVVSALGEAVGVLTQRALIRRRAWTKLGSLLQGPAPVVARTARIGVVAQAMASRGLPAILVVDGEEMAGVVTSDELHRLAIL